MNQKEIFENQYGKKKMLVGEKISFPKLRELMKLFDVDRYLLAIRMTSPGDKILDIGCGDGYTILKLKDKFNNLIGLDIAPSRLIEAEKKVKETYPLEVSRFKFIENNAEGVLPFADNEFDTVLCIASLQFIYDIFFVIQEMYRVTKPGGHVIIEVPNIAYIKYRINLLLGRYPETSSHYNWRNIGWDCGVVHFFTMKNFCWLLEQQGFIIENKSGSGFLAYFRNWWPELLTGDLCIKAVKPK